jgi:hypothetical protein
MEVEWRVSTARFKRGMNMHRRAENRYAFPAIAISPEDFLARPG